VLVLGSTTTSTIVVYFTSLKFSKKVQSHHTSSTSTSDEVPHDFQVLVPKINHTRQKLVANSKRKQYNSPEVIPSSYEWAEDAA
jgi:hypothetical protein